ncbi:hypothetical protein O181_016496 [Austropuccinia psidii MF-1]|uniref:Uncharacterized protein n=1 Tax=Austropuccinia psidii MF-1 TaxID=1389203 RepID=A0A9Q3C5S2_9BASI|nr:hypothetical protein [Austropuccinia psidii MF-1]
MIGSEIGLNSIRGCVITSIQMVNSRIHDQPRPDRVTRPPCPPRPPPSSHPRMIPATHSTLLLHHRPSPPTALDRLIALEIY